MKKGWMELRRKAQEYMASHLKESRAIMMQLAGSTSVFNTGEQQCDLCSSACPLSDMGGHAVLEKDKTYTLVCNRCWMGYSCRLPHEIKINSVFIAQAILSGLGLSSRPVTILDPEKPTVLNFTEFRIKTLHFHGIDSTPESEFDEKELLICVHCFQSTTKKKYKLCGGCRSVSYCSLQCQRKSWAGHKVSCKLVQETLKKAQAIAETFQPGGALPFSVSTTTPQTHPSSPSPSPSPSPIVETATNSSSSSVDDSQPGML